MYANGVDSDQTPFGFGLALLLRKDRTRYCGSVGSVSASYAASGPVIEPCVWHMLSSLTLMQENKLSVTAERLDTEFL